MLDLLNNIFFSRQYIPHGHCYLWQPELLWLHVLSDLFIALAYYSIPLLLIYFIGQREDVPFKGIFVLFSLFILSCGTTHVISIVTLWYPIYWLSGLVKFITAIVSAYTALALIPTLPKALSLRSPTELAAANQALGIEIANRQQAELALKELNQELEQRVEKRTKEYQASEQRFRSLFEAAPDFIYLLNLNGEIEQINPAVIQHSGYAESELIQRELVDLLASNSQKLYQQDFSVLLDGRNSRNEMEFVCKDSTVLTMDCSCTVVGDIQNNDAYILVLQRDISDRKKTEAALKKNEERLQLALEGSGDGLWDWNIITGEVYLSSRWLEMLGYSNDELSGNVNTWEKLIHPEDKSWVMDVLHNHLENDSYPYDFEYRMQTQSGEWKWIGNYGKVVACDDNGKPIRMAGTHKDISDRKKNEEFLKQVNKELAKSNEELERFAYLASHDLREPLRMVTSFTTLLAKRYSERLDQDADKIIGFAVDGARRMEELIDDLLEYSRVDKKNCSLNIVDCETVLDDALGNLQLLISETDTEIIRRNLPTVLGDSGQLVQLFQNLINNAIIYCSEKPPKIEIAVEDRDKEWLFWIKDNGIGIDPQYSDRIFQIFQRLHTKEEYPGTGIGLAICNKIVEIHGGEIWVESAEGKGSTFFFTLPKDS